MTEGTGAGSAARNEDGGGWHQPYPGWPGGLIKNPVMSMQKSVSMGRGHPGTGNYHDRRQTKSEKGIHADHIKTASQDNRDQSETTALSVGSPTNVFQSHPGMSADGGGGGGGGGGRSWRPNGGNGNGGGPNLWAAFSCVVGVCGILCGLFLGFLIFGQGERGRTQAMEGAAGIDGLRADYQSLTRAISEAEATRSRDLAQIQQELERLKDLRRTVTEHEFQIDMLEARSRAPNGKIGVDAPGEGE